jgi:hypothetical protein
MNRLLPWYTATLCTGAILVAAAPAQTPTPPPAAAAPSASAAPRSPQKPTNLKVLPEDTDLHAVMHQYAADLGVHCSFCHAAADPTTHKTDFASDANPTKQTARYMIRMTADLNTKYLAAMPNRHDTDPITCGTCHRGEHHPPDFVAPPEGDHPPAMPGMMAPPASPPATGSSR